MRSGVQAEGLFISICKQIVLFMNRENWEVSNDQDQREGQSVSTQLQNNPPQVVVKRVVCTSIYI